MLNAYSKIKFLELEIIQANVKVERISTKKLDNVLFSQKPSNDKTSLGYTGEGSSSRESKKEVRFVLGKSVEKPKVKTPVVATKRTVGAKPKSQKGPQVKHFCHYCGVRGHTRPNCFKLQALKRANSLRGQDSSRRMPKGNQAKGENERQLIGDVTEMFKNISSCLASFIPKFGNYVGRTPPFKDLTQNTHTV